MKINEVEALVGITKKNIRFYEAEGLLTPRRNSENGYRDYGEEEVETLRRIKLLRKLGVPLEEIRQMQTGVHTGGDGMRRHLVTLERERQNLADAARVCEELTDCQERLEALDAQGLLDRMDRMEEEGTTFMDKQKRDMKRRRYVMPVVMAQNRYKRSIGSLMAVRNRTMDNAPTMPSEMTMLVLMAKVTMQVSTVMPTSVRANPRLNTTP